MTSPLPGPTRLPEGAHHAGPTYGAARPQTLPAPMLPAHMLPAQTAVAAAARAEPVETPVFQLSTIRDLLVYLLHALRRRRRLALSIFGAIAGTTVLAAIFLPRSYYTETKIMAQKNIVMPALGNPRRPAAAEPEAPNRFAGDAVLRRDNLVEIIRETNLLALWPQIQSPASKAKDFILTKLGHGRTQDQRIDALVGMLQKYMWVQSGEGTVTIGVTWPDATSAFHIVQVAQRNFIDQRHASEISMIGESIAILESHIQSAEAAIQSARDEVDRARGRAPAPSLASIGGALRPRAAPASPEVTSLRALLSAKRQAIADLESIRSRRLAELQTRQAELRNSYGPAHPEIASTQQSIQALLGDSPALVALRSEEAQLRGQLAKLGAAPTDAPVGSPTEPFLARAALERLSRPSVDSVEDPRITYAKSRLKIAISDYEDLLDRQESARIELETARAAFKYRYNVITPPEIPTRPAKPKVPLLLAAGLFLATALAVFAAVVFDLASGRLYEPWQVERLVGLPVLAQLRRA